MENVFVKLSLAPWLWYDLIVSPHVKQPPINLPKKVCSSMTRFLFKKKVPPYILWRGGMRHYVLSSYLFPFLKVSSLTFEVQTIVFQAKLPRATVFFKVIQYGHENFPNYFESELQNHLVINWSLISNKAPNL